MLSLRAGTLIGCLTVGWCLAVVPVRVAQAEEAQPADEGAAARLASVEISGRLVETPDKLLRFLGLVPGARFDDEADKNVASLLSGLGYRIVEKRLTPTAQGIKLLLRVELVRLVRKLSVKGNFPLFDDDVLRHLTLRSGTQLVADEDLADRLDEEAERVKKYLFREGYFSAQVRVVPLKGPRPEWIDLQVRVTLGPYYSLGAVRGSGNKLLSDLELYDRFSHCCWWWGRFGEQRMRDDARDTEGWLRLRGYPSARVLPDFDPNRDADPVTRRVKLPVKVSEKRRVEVEFLGNRNLDEKQLREQLTIFTAGSSDDVELAESGRAIERLYQQHGYFQAKVTFQRDRTRRDLESVTFLIDEGPELRVREVEFRSIDGRSLMFSAEELRSRADLQTRVFPRLGSLGLGDGGYVSPLQLQQDNERLVEFYRSRGFPSASVRGLVARAPEDLDSIGALGAALAGDLGGKDLYVRFEIDEGRRERVEGVDLEFVGEHLKSAQDLRGVLQMTGGQPFTEAGFAADQKRIVDQYRSLGRPYVQVSYARSTWNATHERVILRYLVDEGPEVRFGDIVVRGNFNTRTRVILRDLPFKTGDLFDFAKVELAERNLQTHQIFTSASVAPVGMSSARRPVPILVNVQERYMDYGGLYVAVGAATDRIPYYVYASLAYVYNNVAGFGSQLEIRGEYSPVDYGAASVRYTDLRVFGPKWRLDINAFVRREFTSRLGTIQTYGGSVGLTHYIRPTLSVFGRYDLYLSQLDVPYIRLNSANSRASVPDNTVIGKFVLGIAWDKRVGEDGTPNPIAPTKGWLLSLAVTPSSRYLSGLLGNSDFLVVSGQAMGILPFKVRRSQFTLLANVRYDHGIPFGDAALPAVERFFAGGDTTTRGYEPDQLRTEIIRSDVSPISGGQGFRVIPQGGNIRFLGTAELVFPIAKTFLTLPARWVGAIFYDVGALYDAPAQVKASDWKHAIGISLLRVLTPFGALSLEYAYPLTQTLAEERWKTNPWYSHFPGRIHFNWGIPLARY